MALDFTKYKGPHTTYTNPDGEDIEVSKSVAKTLHTQNKEDIQVSLDQYSTDDLKKQKDFIVKSARGDQQFTSFTSEAYLYTDGRKIKRTGGNMGNTEWNDAGYRIHTGAYTTARFSSEHARTLFGDIPEVQGGDYTDNALKDEILQMAFIESGLKYIDFCKRFALDPLHMPDYTTLMLLLEVFLKENQISIAFQAGANHDVGIGGNAGNYTLPLETASHRLEQTKGLYVAALNEKGLLNDDKAQIAYLEPWKVPMTQVLLAYFRHSAPPEYARLNQTHSFNSDDTLPTLDISLLNLRAQNTFIQHPELKELYFDYAQATLDLEASQTYQHLKENQPQRRKGVFALLPEAFTLKLLGTSLGILPNQRPHEAFFGHSDEEYFSGAVTDTLLELHYPEYPDTEAFKKMTTNYVHATNLAEGEWVASKYSFSYGETYSKPIQNAFTLEKLMSLSPEEIVNQFNIFWQQTRSKEGKNEWVCRIEYTDRPGLDAAETSFVLKLQELGLKDGVRHFSLFWPVDGTDFRPATYYYDSVSDLALALMSLGTNALELLYPNDTVLVHQEKHWGYHETFKPTAYKGAPVTVSDVITSKAVSPFSMAWHNHAGTLFNFKRKQEYIAGRRLPFLGSPIVTKEARTTNHVMIQGQSVTDFGGVYYVHLAQSNSETQEIQETYVAMDPVQEFLNSLTDSQKSSLDAALSGARVSLATYLDADFYTKGTTYNFQKGLIRKKVLMGKESASDFNEELITQDVLPTHARLVEMNLAFTREILKSLKAEATLATTSYDKYKFEFYIKSYESSLFELEQHFEAWKARFGASYATEEERLLACEDLYQNSNFITRSLLSVDLEDTKDIAPTTFALALSLEREFTTLDREPFNKEMLDNLNNSPWQYGNALTATYKIPQKQITPLTPAPVNWEDNLKKINETLENPNAEIQVASHP